MILTDGEKTEENYFTGLKDSLQEGTPLSVEIHTKIKVDRLIEKCNTLRNEDIFPDFNPARIWIVFDRDRVVNFDAIIQEAKQIKCEVAWSNPCIEEWFWAYFDSLGSHTDSVTTNDLFKELFVTKTGRRYVKNLSNLYEILRTKGNEEKAIRRAEEKLISMKNSGVIRPSDMYSATTVFRLVREWRNLDAT
ncbi:MAG TPA: RloB family protein [Methanocorpusculum sp.]|nr:RloB family protein [Methanocorpusculum sp.]